MNNIIVAQYIYQRGEDGKFVSRRMLSEIASPFTQKVYEKLNDLLLGYKINKDIEKEDLLIINEIIMEFKSVKEELNPVEDIYLGVDELLENDELCRSLKNVKFIFSSEIDPASVSDEVKKIISILENTFKNDIVNFLNKEKDLKIRIEG